MGASVYYVNLKYFDAISMKFLRMRIAAECKVYRFEFREIFTRANMNADGDEESTLEISISMCVPAGAPNAPKSALPQRASIESFSSKSDDSGGGCVSGSEP